MGTLWFNITCLFKLFQIRIYLLDDSLVRIHTVVDLTKYDPGIITGVAYVEYLQFKTAL